MVYLSSIRKTLYSILIGCLLCFLVACSTGGAATPQTPATPRSGSTGGPTPTPVPPGTVLYRADWSHDLSSWQGIQGWRVIQGQLETTAQHQTTLVVPYTPTVSNYALEVRIQIVSLLQKNGGYFSIAAGQTPDKDGFQAGVSDLKGPGPRPNGSHPQAQAFIVPYSSMAPGSGRPIDFEPGSQWHTYRVAVRDNQVDLLVDGVEAAGASSNQTEHLSYGPLSLTCASVVLRVADLKIVAL